MIIANKLRRDIAKKEITRNPIFLLQSKHFICVCDNCIDEDDPELCDNSFIEWQTESIFSTREAAEEFGEQTTYRYPNGWKVYCIPCADELHEILNNHDFFYRLLRVIEALSERSGMIEHDKKLLNKQIDQFYRFAHLVSINCIRNHPAWLEELEKTEQGLKEANII